MSSKTLRVCWFVAVFALLAPLAGCSSSSATKRIVAFSEAVDLVATNIEDSFDAVDTAYFEAEVARTAASKASVVAFNPDRFSSWLPPEEVKVRVTLLDGLSKYADALADVMTADQLGAFDEATVALGERLNSLTSTPAFNALAGNALDRAEVSVLVTAVNAIGRWFIASKRDQKVKSTIADMNPHIQSISDFLAKDFEALRAQSKGAFQRRMSHSHGFIVNNYDQMDPVARYEQVHRLASLTRQMQSADHTLQRAAASMCKLATTHAKLEKAFDKDAFDLEAAIRGLIDEGKRIKDFYESLNASD